MAFSPEKPLSTIASGLTQQRGGAVQNFGVTGVIGTLRSANMNSTADQFIPLNTGIWIPTGILITNASTSLTTAVGGFYPSAAKGGTALVANTQVYSALTSGTVALYATLAANISTTRYSQNFIYFSLTTPQGAAATADIYVIGTDLT